MSYVEQLRKKIGHDEYIGVGAGIFIYKDRMGYLKGKSSLMIFDRHANLKYKYRDRHFWARGYYVDTVGRNKKQIQEYIKHQLEEDQIADQMSLKEFIDPFTGSKNTKA